MQSYRRTYVQPSSAHRKTRGDGRTCAPLLSKMCASLPVQRACFPSYVSYVYPCVRVFVSPAFRPFVRGVWMCRRSLAGRTRVVVARVAGEGRAGSGISLPLSLHASFQRKTFPPSRDLAFRPALAGPSPSPPSRFELSFGFLITYSQIQPLPNPRTQTRIAIRATEYHSAASRLAQAKRKSNTLYPD